MAVNLRAILLHCLKEAHPAADMLSCAGGSRLLDVAPQSIGPEATQLTRVNWLRRAILVGALLTALPAYAWSATIEDVIKLSRAGVRDAVIIGLIQTDGSHFVLTADDLLMLQEAGVSDDVLLAMLETGRPEPPSPASTIAAEDDAARGPAMPASTPMTARPVPGAGYWPVSAVFPWPSVIVVPVFVGAPAPPKDDHGVGRGRLANHGLIGIDGLPIRSGSFINKGFLPSPPPTPASIARGEVR